ncbi:DEAD/DEAH box helicase [Variovorax atrisoli]|uniref:DEAD/DEAH box helicase n=1 Tax=Variovorax atrisoli TaxID=3394203 RepID=UPI003399ADF7
MTQPYFAALLPELATRAARSTVSRLGFSSAPLRAHLMEVFSRGFGERGAFLGAPVFEATFGWKTSGHTMAEMSGILLHPELIEAMDNPPGGHGSEYRFPREAHPYVHQIAAWEHLCAPQPRSVVVTSGTGSGKTECFMVPILNKLVADHHEANAKLVGVRAIFLYPLNALIQSQRERLTAWTARFGGGIRFCLYNGLTPNRLKQEQREASPNEVIDREMLRAAPPPILVTNPTMLEYMLVRADDAPILEASKGRLQWVVIDEAHTYIGSQAAELALLLRRVLYAFGVRADEVRFVATSATIAGKPGESDEALRDFIARLAGVSQERVHVVAGSRSIPEIPEVEAGANDLTLEQLEALDDTVPGTRYAALCNQPRARALRALFVPGSGGTSANTLSEIATVLQESSPGSKSAQELDTLRWLDCLSEAKSAPGKDTLPLPFLPLRLHAFHNVLAGLWACCDERCSSRKGTLLDHPEWPYGMVHTEERSHCECGAPVYELRSCNDCNATFLWGRRVHRQTDGLYRLLPAAEESVDEFTLDVEPDDDGETAEDAVAKGDPVLIANGRSVGTASALVDRASRVLDPADATDAIRLTLKDRTSTKDGAHMTCPECGGHHGSDQQMFRRAILGAPFLLGEIIPTLLEFCPDGELPTSRPMRGRRMITFTDSRQGTARIAAKLQQDSERNRVRGAIYLHVLDSARGADPEALAAIDNQITALAAIPSNPAIESILQQKRVERETLAKPKPVPFAATVQWLSTTVPDVRDWMHRFYSALDPAEFESPSGKERMAKMLVMREFARRPKRLNSLETMGLVAVQYPKLAMLGSRPEVVVDQSISLEDWKNFLKTALDLHVREGTFIELPDSWRKWGGNRIASKLLLNPLSTETQTNRLKRWPQCSSGSRQNRLVRILSYALGLNPETPTGKDRIDLILRAAWDDLVKLELLRAGGNGRFLSLEDIAFAPITDGWVCPVTRRILDTTFKGVTPYLPSGSATPATAECRAVQVPLSYLSKKDFASESEKLSAIRDWAGSDASIVALRSEGLWSDLSDRIIEGGLYFRAVEHSAQQAGSRLQEYERDFKNGYLNVLSCSTTMEMGVDIGGINMVAMNNVPPHPANYLQRAGRAGRRGETRSVALTLCKNNPHDQQIFSNTLWPFRTILPAPSISLSSPVLVQRHVNAMLLADFLRREAAKTSLEKLDMGWWMLPLGASRVDRFVAAVSCFEEAKEADLASGLTSLLRHTVFEGRQSLVRLASTCASAAKVHGLKWAAEYASIQEQMKLFDLSGKEKDPAYKSLLIQAKRLSGEYLLRELASGGFLPGYGFPTGITSFDTLNKDALERVRLEQERLAGSGKRRIDNAFRRRELPSRDNVTALREYAPGAEVVIDGLVYRSAGITLNWHAPASAQDVSEIQNIRAAWRCRACGSSGNNVLAEPQQKCADCGALIQNDPASSFRYLEPAGFAVDLYEASHNDISIQSFVPVEAPWVNASGEWLALANPELGRFRATSLGTVFNHTAGANGLGFAVCLECGRSEPMIADTTADENGSVAPARPFAFRQPHRRLRGAQGGESKMCAGSDQPFSVQSALRFGCESTTDVLELVLQGLDGKPLTDRSTAYSIAVALRGAVAATLGVEETELGCDTKEIRLPDGSRAQAVLVFDRNASGYSSAVSDKLESVLRRASENLQCTHDCDAACQHCLLSFDTRFRHDDLNRHAALTFLSNRWLDELRLKKADAHFGEDKSFAEFQSLPESLSRELAHPSASELLIYLAGEHDDWDLAGSALRHWIHRWSLEEKPVKLVIDPVIAAVLTTEEKFALTVLQTYNNVAVHTGVPADCASGVVTCATIVRSDGPDRSWAVQQPRASTPTSMWGEPGTAPLVWGYAGPTKIGALADLTRVEALGRTETIHIEIGSEIDGSVYGFGTRLLKRLLSALPDSRLPGSSTVKRVTYHDRYLNSPLPAMLLVELISALKEYCLSEGRWELEVVRVVTSDIPAMPSFRLATSLVHNWPNGQERSDAIAAAVEYCGLRCEIDCVDKRDARHARCLEIEFGDGSELTVWFDQGFGYWTVPRDPNLRRSGILDFPFSASASDQGESIASPKASVTGQRFTTHVFISAG